MAIISSSPVINTFSLLILSILGWLICILIFVFFREERVTEGGRKLKSGDDVVKRLFVYALSFFFLISILAFSLVEVACVSCDCEDKIVYNESGQEYYNVTVCDTKIGDTEIYPLWKTFIPFGLVLIIQLIYLIYYLYNLAVEGVSLSKK